MIIFDKICLVVKQLIGKDKRKMLNKIKDEESIIMIFFVGALVSLGGSFLFKRNLIDVIYFIVLFGYFWKFLIIKNK